MKGPSRLMLEAFEANEAEKKMRQKSTKAAMSGGASNKKEQQDGGVTFKRFANGFLDEQPNENSIAGKEDVTPIE